MGYNALRDYVGKNKKILLVYAGLASAGLVIKAYGGNWSPTGDLVLGFDAALFVMERIYDSPSEF